MLLIFARIIATGSWLAVLGFFLGYSYSVKRYLPNIQLPIRPKTSVNAVLMIFYFLFYAILWTNETSLQNTLPPQWVLSSVFFGFILIITGTTLMIWATKSLYDRWLISTSILDFGIFQSNPFTFIRHPFYSGQILIWLGSVLIFINPFGLVLGLLILIPILKNQSKKDEAALIASYGDLYFEYKNRAGLFFPKIW